VLVVGLPTSSGLSEETAGSEAVADVPSPPGEIHFVGKNKVATANSVFHRWTVTRAEIDPAAIGEGVVEIEIDVASLDTGIAKRDEHLRTADFFDVAQFPTATVRLYDARPLEEQPEGEEWFEAQMDLTIRGIEKTQEVLFRLVDRRAFIVRGEFTVLRTDFGVGEPHTQGNPLSIEDEVHLSFEATLFGES
jgi:polyisoprenoid-binding protein YceI